jgi:uncharacterized protein (TIGR03067 family)
VTKYVLTVLVVGLLLGAEGKKDDATKDRVALQGTWKVVSVERLGKAEGDPGDFVMAFIDDTFTVKKGDEVIVRGTFKVDPAKTPKTIDMKIAEAKKEQDNGKEVHGIYELGRDTLKWCAAEPGSTERPKEFATKEGTKDMLVTFKKEKP